MRAVEEGIYSTVQVTTNGAGILCRKEGWKEADGTRLLISERVDYQEQLSSTLNIGGLGEYWDEENLYENGSEVGIQ